MKSNLEPSSLKVLQTTDMSVSFTTFLDASRWVAAMIVFLGHLRDPLFLGYGALLPEHRSLAVQGWYLVTGWFGEAVIVFFVLSGFLVGGFGYIKARDGKFRAPSYAIDRFTRLFVPFVPVLAATIALDYIGAHFLPDVGLYSHSHPMVLEKVNSEAFAHYLNVKTAVLNLFMLQTIVAPPLGSNQPLWTISLEFWFYVVFGLFITLSACSRWLSRYIGYAALLVLVGVLGWDFTRYLGIWVVGMSAILIRSSKWERPLISLTVFLVLLLVSRIVKTYYAKSEWLLLLRDYGVALCFAWVLVSFRNAKFVLLEKTAYLHRVMAGFSYSLYLIHFPLMIFLMSLLYSTGAFNCVAVGCAPTSSAGLLAQAIIVSCVLACAWAFAEVTEKQTPRVRAWLKTIWVES